MMSPHLSVWRHLGTISLFKKTFKILMYAFFLCSLSIYYEVNHSELISTSWLNYCWCYCWSFKGFCWVHPLLILGTSQRQVVPSVMATSRFFWPYVSMYICMYLAALLSLLSAGLMGESHAEERFLTPQFCSFIQSLFNSNNHHIDLTASACQIGECLKSITYTYKSLRLQNL